MAIIGGIVSVLVGSMIGGDLLDGFAGGPQHNTFLESFLMDGGLIVATCGVALALLTLVLFLGWKFQQRRKLERARVTGILYIVTACLVLGILLVLSMFIFSWGIW